MAQHVINRVLIIGIDGATFDVIKPQVDAGNMPVLKRLMDEGAHGILRSTLPPITGPAWRTFATGCNPGKHGVIDFVDFDFQTRKVRVKDLSHVPVPTFWDEMGRQGKRVGIIGVPMTYPPRPVNGFILTGLMTPPGSDKFTFPANLAEEIKARGLSFPISEGESANASQPETYITQVIADVERRVQTAVHLLEEHRPDGAAFVIGASDPLQHQFFHHLDGSSQGADSERMQQLLARFYRSVDEAIDRLLACADANTLVMVVSDHGFGRLKGFIHLNNWLLERGYLRLRRDPLTQLRYLAHRLGYTPENLYRLAKSLGLDVRRRLNRGRVFSVTRLAFLSFANVDWSRTRAFGLGHIGQMYINRTPEMTDSDYQQLREELRADLLEMQHPTTGESLIARVHTRDELYEGPYADAAPDLILEPAGFEHVAFGESEFASNLIVGPSLHSGHHRLEGILIAHGPGVRRGVALAENGIADIAPTALWAMGLGVPSHMDGQPMEAVFEDAFVANNPLRLVDGAGAGEGDPEGGYSEDEEALVRQRLRDLGYTA